jgi:hypothetical protein
MGAALLDGFERGFNMMERHDARVGRKERLSRMDEQNESRYQDGQARQSEIDKQNESRYLAGQTRLSDMDKQNESRYQDNKARQVTNDKAAVDYRASMLSSSQENTENQQKHYKWQQNVKDREQKWSLIAPQLENIHNQFFETGTMPEQAAQFFKDTPLYNDYNPATYTDKKRRDSIKQLEAKTKGALDSGNFAVFKEPEFLKLFNTSYQSTIKRGVGDFDDKEGATIVDKELGQLIPAGEGSVSIELNVTYQKPNGDKYTKPQPMTKGGTNEEGDPVNRWSLGEMMNTMKVRSSMADLAENGEKYRARSEQTLGAMRNTPQEDLAAKTRKAYLKEVGSIQKEMRKVRSDSDLVSTPDEIEDKLKHHKIAINAIDKEYGRNPSFPVAVKGGSSKEQVKSPPANLLTEGKQTKFKNGQVWTLENGKAIQVNEG